MPSAVRGKVRSGRGASGLGVVLGEIHTGLLQNSTGISPETALELLQVAPVRTVTGWERPISQVVSPEALHGVDCEIPSASDERRRAVGTVAVSSRITGGQVVQAATRARLVQADTQHRHPWQHYLAWPGTVEVWGRAEPGDVVAGFFADVSGPDVLDLGGVSAFQLSSLQSSSVLDRRPRMRLTRGRLRWAAITTDGPAQVAFSLPGPLRTLRLEMPPEHTDAVQDLCQDIALHDWLLSSVLGMIELAHIGSRGRWEVAQRLAPSVDHLLHLWMPGARLDDDMMIYWAEFERVARITRQWNAAALRIRDQLLLASADPGRPPLDLSYVPVAST